MEGFYFDPLHGNCLRRIRTVLPCETYRVDGVYGNDEPNEGEHWFAFIRVVSRTDSKWKLEVDFAGKPIKKKKLLKATFLPRKRCIRWEDRNVWKKLYVNARQLA